MTVDMKNIYHLFLAPEIEMRDLPNERLTVNVHIEDEWGEGHGSNLEGKSSLSLLIV